MSAHCSHDLVFRQMWSIDYCWRILSAIIADVGDPGPPMSYQHSQLHVEKNAQYGSAIVHLRSTRMLYGEFSLWVSLILPFGPNQHGQGCRMRHLIRARVQRHYFQFGRPNNDTAESCGCICGRKRNVTPLDASEQRAAWCLMGFLIRSA